MVRIFLESLILGVILFWLGVKYQPGWLKKRWGGIILIIAFIFLVLFHRELELTPQIRGLILGSIFILFFGLLDDYFNLNWKWQFLFQIFLVVVLIFSGFQIDSIRLLSGEWRLDNWIFQSISWGSAVFIFFWVVSLINALNWLDGIDSSLVAVALPGALSIMAVSFFPEVNQPAIGILAIILSGLLAAFLFFNFPPAKVEAGTTGSYFIGFILAALAIIAGSKIATASVVLLLPLLDFLWVIAERMTDGQIVTLKDKRHLHYRLRELGWSQRKIFFVYFLFSLTVLVLYLQLDTRFQRLTLLVGEGLSILLFLGIIRIRLRKLKDNNKSN